MSAEEETTMHVEEPQEAEAVAEGEQKTNLRKRRPRAAKQVEPKKEEPEPIEMLSDDMKEELQFFKLKLPNMEARLKEVYEDMLRPLLDQKKVMEIAVDELPGIIQVVNDKGNLTSLEPNQVRLLVKAFVLIDGSTDSFTKLNSLIKERLQALHVDPDTLNENFAPELIRLISEEEEISGLDEQPIKYREIKDIDLLKNEPDFSDFVGTSALRKRVSGLVDSLARFLKHLRKEKPTEKLVHKLKESDKKVIAAEEKLKKEQEKTKQRELAASKLAQEKAEKLLKVEMKEKARKEVEEKKRREAEEKEEKRKEEERRKEEKRKEEEKKKEEKEEERKRKEEEKKKKEEEKRLEELAQKQKKAEEDAQKEKNRVALTKFFNVLPKQGETEKQIVEEVVVEEKKCVWKKGLGCLNRTQDWNEERKQDFDDLINKLGTQILGGDSNSSKMNIEFVFDMECRLLFDSLKSQMKHLKEDSASSIKCEMEDGTNDEKKKLPPRRVFIKYEDYLMDCYEYRGMFKRRSLLVTPRNPISKDEDLIDYELSSDEEFQLEEADSIHSKAGDDEEEESGNEFEEDNFVVPDGYLSEEEFGSLDEEDKKDYKQRRNGQHQSGDGSNKPHFYDFTKYKPGEDYTLDELANTVKAIPINSSFPVIVLIEQEETAPEKELINEEFMLDLVKSTHCCNNKLALIEQMKEK